MHLRTVLVTGSSRGIGLELVRQLAHLTAGPTHIFAACRNPDKAQDLLSISVQCPSVHLIRMDVTDDSSIETAVGQVESILNTTSDGLNLLINNAGIADASLGGHRFPEANRDVYRNHFDVNCIGVVMVTQAFLLLMRKAARMSNSSKMGIHKAAIVNISSTLGSIAANISGSKIMENVIYRMTKTALNQLTKTLSVDLEPDQILAISICPGWVQTDLGGPTARMKVTDSVCLLLNTMNDLDQQHNGMFLSLNGKSIPY